LLLRGECCVFGCGFVVVVVVVVAFVVVFLLFSCCLLGFCFSHAPAFESTSGRAATKTIFFVCCRFGPTCRGPGNIALGLASPVFITSLILYVSGVPMLEEQHDEKYGDDPRYDARSWSQVLTTVVDHQSVIVRPSRAKMCSETLSPRTPAEPGCTDHTCILSLARLSSLFPP